MKRIKILLVDDQPLFREGLRTLLSVHYDFEVVGEAGNGKEAICLVRLRRPSVVLMDLQMPVLDGVAATRRLHAEQPECRVIVLTTFDDDEMVFEGLRAGAVGYLLSGMQISTHEPRWLATCAPASPPARRTRATAWPPG